MDCGNDWRSVLMSLMSKWLFLCPTVGDGPSFETTGRLRFDDNCSARLANTGCHKGVRFSAPLSRLLEPRGPFVDDALAFMPSCWMMLDSTRSSLTTTIDARCPHRNDNNHEASHCKLLHSTPSTQISGRSLRFIGRTSAHLALQVR